MNTITLELPLAEVEGLHQAAAYTIAVPEYMEALFRKEEEWKSAIAGFLKLNDYIQQGCKQELTLAETVGLSQTAGHSIEYEQLGGPNLPGYEPLESAKAGFEKLNDLIQEAGGWEIIPRENRRG